MARITYQGFTKTATIQALKDRLKISRELSKEEQNFICGAFSTFYPEHWKEKTEGAKLIGVKIKNHPEFHSAGYWLIFSNREETPISVKGAGSPRSDLMRACREAVRPIIHDFTTVANQTSLRKF